MSFANALRAVGGIEGLVKAVDCGNRAPLKIVLDAGQQLEDALAAKAGATGHLFQLGDFVLNSGARSRWKLECNALGAGDWQALGQMIRQLVGSYSAVEGVPEGGLPLARYLNQFSSLEGSVLIVDDVLTTGGSMETLRNKLCDERKLEPVQFVGAVVFARGKCPPWIKAVFQMPEPFWVKRPVTRSE